MKTLLPVILALVAHFSLAQDEKANYKVVTKKFVQKYNSIDYNGIFSMFSVDMKEVLPLSKTTTFFEELQSQAGNISTWEFTGYEKETYAAYKTTFEHNVFMLNISVDDSSHINGLFVSPFNEKVSSKSTKINNLILKNGVITQKQAEIIAEKVGSFPNHTEIAFALIEDGNPKYVGVKIENDTISAIHNQNSVFEIGSISKVFTSTLLANFVIEGKMNLDDHINDYLKTPLNNNTKITFVDLANHTSGLPRLPSNIKVTQVNPYKKYKAKKLKKYLTRYLELSGKGKYQYSNLGAALIGYTLAKFEKTSYEALLQEKICSKFNMNQSTAARNKVKGKLVKGLDNYGREVENWEFSVLAGAGAIFSTVEDLTHFAIAQFDATNKALQLTQEETFEINENMAIGLGWHILKTQSKSHWLWHNGRTNGYSSSMVIDEKTKNGIIILSNVSGLSPNTAHIDELCFKLMRSIE